jgi:hypothetical protein
MTLKEFYQRACDIAGPAADAVAVQVEYKTTGHYYCVYSAAPGVCGHGSTVNAALAQFKECFMLPEHVDEIGGAE